MNERKTTYNALNIRGLKKLPPPVCDNLKALQPTGLSYHPALLHQASASCGRVPIANGLKI